MPIPTGSSSILDHTSCERSERNRDTLVPSDDGIARTTAGRAADTAARGG